MVTAPAHVRLIPKSLFGPEVLAQLMVSKYADHLPLHRQLKICRRAGIELCESTVNEAVLRGAEKLAPLVDRLSAHVLAGPRIFTEDTPILLKGNRPEERCLARLWVYIRHGEEEGAPATFFDFTTDRCRDGPLGILGDFQGYLQADAYACRLQRWIAGQG